MAVVTSAACYAGPLVKYFVEIEGETFEVEVTGDEIRLDGEQVTIDLTQSGMPELYSVLIDDKSHEVLVNEASPALDVTLYGHSFKATVQDEAERAFQLGRGPSQELEGDLAVTAPISGLVVIVPVTEGEEVVQGQTLVVLEAMKMENEITAPRAGRIRDVQVEPGERVEMDFAMMILEQSRDAEEHQG